MEHYNSHGCLSNCTYASGDFDYVTRASGDTVQNPGVSPVNSPSDREENLAHP